MGTEGAASVINGEEKRARSFRPMLHRFNHEEVSRVRRMGIWNLALKKAAVNGQQRQRT